LALTIGPSDEEERLVRALQEGLVAIWEEESEQHVRREGAYYPSSIGSCLRKQFYQYTIEEKADPERLAVFATGKGVHAAVAEALRKSGLVTVDAEEYPVELKISDEVKLSGRVDVLLVELDGKKVVVEVKSTSKLPDSPHENHYLQLQTYLHSMGLEKGFLLYWDKRTGGLKAFKASREASALQKIGERAIILHEHLKAGKAPFKEAVMENRYWECDFCDYYSICSPFLVEGVPKGSAVSVFDLDGVVVDDGARVAQALGKMGLPKDLTPGDLRGPLRDRFNSEYHDPASLSHDRVRKDVIKLMSEEKAAGSFILILSERPSQLRGKTEEELRRFRVPYDVLILMPQDYSKSFFWKADMLKRLGDLYRIKRLVDDSPSVRNDAAKLGIAAEAPPSP
jgi:CRISPR/Cas system-associated exonuclease Cas4 (RecB family)